LRGRAEDSELTVILGAKSRKFQVFSQSLYLTIPFMRSAARPDSIDEENFWLTCGILDHVVETLLERVDAILDLHNTFFNACYV
jgi:hypothetical protein